MPFKVGDIVVKQAGAFGHALMCVAARNGRISEQFIHATNAGNFRIDAQESEEDGSSYYLLERNYAHFSPAVELSAAKKIELVAVANRIAATTKYGIYRAVRVWAGSSTFGSSARARLLKYRSRLNGGDVGVVVTTVTCAEAVMLCHQLISAESNPAFIKRDAAHTMPRDLLKYLNDSAHWTCTVIA